MRSIIYQSDVRAQDPVGGCYRIIRELERQIAMSNAELELVLQQLAVCRNVGMHTRNEEFFDYNDEEVDCDPRLYEHHGLNEQNHASVCDDFKLLLIDDVTTLDYKYKETNKPSEESLYIDENQKDLVEVEKVSYQEYNHEERVALKDAATFATLSDCKAT
ncbi:LOB domain-containing protein 22-like protein [Tanacetum coccineum]